MEEVVKLANTLEKIAAGKKSEDSALDIVKKLSSMEITIDVLQKTRVGMTINEIRKKTSNEELAATAKALIKAWKKLLDGKAAPPRDKGAANGDKRDPPTTSAPAAPAAPPSVEGVRGKCVQMLTNSLNIGELPTGTLVPEDLAHKIEAKLFDFHKGTGSKYSAAIRSRVFNLRDKKNPELRLNILTGVISPERFALMSSEEMASADVKMLREKFTKDAIEEHQVTLEGGTATDMFKCGKCKKHNCTYSQVQTRSADEPMTTFVFCRECGNRWKFC